MKYTPFHQYRISQLALGTIQLGMRYGIANTTGAPAKEEAFSILDLARQSGINTFDTARTYGRAEKVLGDYFARNPSDEDLVISKFKYDWTPGMTLEAAWKSVRSSVEQSVSELNVSRVPLVLYHKGPDEPMEEVLRIVPAMIDRLKEEELIACGGISVNYSREAGSVAEHAAFEAVQIPLNILDQKVINDGSLEKLHEAGRIIFVRSVFLQGLFFRDPRELTGILKEASPYLENLHALAHDYRLTMAEMAFAFIRDLAEADSLVVGAENASQVQSNLALLNGPELPESLRAELKSLAADVPKPVITPGMWN
ncbi:MAG: hypothetical protein ABS46_11685 [Cytophagaceae bacterium SCN 52-12]|nr:MAG: hypothetical protein ABS46_11685 [Cytophagaceae bacterium SCN 52-12]